MSIVTTSARQVLNGMGTTAPVPISLGGAQTVVFPPLSIIFYSPDADMLAIVEATPDDAVNGVIPPTALWLPCIEWGNNGNRMGLTAVGASNPGAALNGSAYVPLVYNMSAIRVRMLKWVAGSLTFLVRQVSTPNLVLGGGQ